MYNTTDPVQALANMETMTIEAGSSVGGEFLAYLAEAAHHYRAIHVAMEIFEHEDASIVRPRLRRRMRDRLRSSGTVAGADEAVGDGPFEDRQTQL